MIRKYTAIYSEQYWKDHNWLGQMNREEYTKLQIQNQYKKKPSLELIKKPMQNSGGITGYKEEPKKCQIPEQIVPFLLKCRPGGKILQRTSQGQQPAAPPSEISSAAPEFAHLPLLLFQVPNYLVLKYPIVPLYQL